MSKLNHVIIKTKRAVFNSVIGDNSSIFNGEGYDFVELREYQPNDDIKKIDWIISAKQNKPYVKIFKENRELNIVIVPIIDGNTYFGQKIFKQDIIAQVSSILGFSAVKLNNNFQNIIFTNRVYSSSKPSKKNFAVIDMVKKILDIKPLKVKKDFKYITETIFKRVKKKSIIFIVSDFFDDIDLSLISQKHEVIAIIVRDRFEENPYSLGDISLIDPVDDIEIDTQISDKEINQYKSIVARRDRELLEHFKKYRVKFTKIYTDEKPIVKLLKLYGDK